MKEDEKMTENKVKVNKYEMDMTSGNFFKKIIKFCIPLMLTGILQLFYNAADLIIVGKFGDEVNAVGAVGSTSALINLLVNLFMGLSIGANVMCARSFASNDKVKLERVVHTSITVSAICGFVLSAVGIALADVLLTLMDNPLSLARVYLRIYFIGMPFNMVYNFAASILRGVGDTKRPLYYLLISGALNVVLNFIFVYFFKMNVDGVAIATVISQVVSCTLIMICLLKSKEAYKFRFNKIRIHKKELLEITKIGLPAGIQGSIFSISNVIIQSSVNKFGDIVINGNATAQSIEGFVYMAINSVYSAALAFVGQNMGAKKYENIKKITIDCLLFVVLVGVVMGGSFFLAGRQLAYIYINTDKVVNVEEIISVVRIRLCYLCLPYALCGIMDVMVGVLRGMGKSFVPMIVSIVGVCGFRILWIYLVFYNFTDFKEATDLHLLYVSYPISWIVTFSIHLVTYFIIKRNLFKKVEQEKLMYA